MVIGPVSGYFHQYYTIYKMKTSMGFSSFTCGVLLIANITRIFFWIGDPFELPLLYQSILMIIVQLFLLEICVRYYPWTVQLPMSVQHSIPSSSRYMATNNNSNSDISVNSSGNGGLQSGNATVLNSLGSDHIPSRASRRHNAGWYREHAMLWGVKFWNWPTIWPYFLFVATYTSLLALSMHFFQNGKVYVETLGLVALGVEATVPVPQALQNFRTKSTAGFSPTILLMWVVGDSVKVFYFILRQAKYQFVLCGCIQLCIDGVIIVQTLIYSKWWRTRWLSSSNSLSSAPFHADDSEDLEDNSGGDVSAMEHYILATIMECQTLKMLSTCIGENFHSAQDEIAEQILAITNTLEVLRERFEQAYREEQEQLRLSKLQQQQQQQDTASSKSKGSRWDGAFSSMSIISKGSSYPTQPDRDRDVYLLPPNLHPLVLSIWATSNTEGAFRGALGRELHGLLVERRKHLRELELVKKRSEEKEG
ncbi:hypothetical protein BGZ65_005144 [Modicella reniformis]|uniref:Uncharacterized protein n=1 Tax=Modicella reniformis TaxID=1440133 RepID=A0A9P6ST51_9FUNG|nr:hypothetical protein BGZ65_005144 [Modicella reniformis]